MRKFLPDFDVVLALAVACVTTACHLPVLGGGSMRNHPSALVGEWVDSAKTTPTDTSLWILEASGNDVSQHVRVEADSARRPSGAVVVVMSRPKHYGYW